MRVPGFHFVEKQVIQAEGVVYKKLRSTEYEVGKGQIRNTLYALAKDHGLYPEVGSSV